MQAVCVCVGVCAEGLSECAELRVGGVNAKSLLDAELPSSPEAAAGGARGKPLTVCGQFPQMLMIFCLFSFMYFSWPVRCVVSACFCVYMPPECAYECACRPIQVCMQICCKIKENIIL